MSKRKTAGIPYTVWFVNDALPDEFYQWNIFDVQRFLTKRGCFLKDYKMPNGKLFSKWLEKECYTRNINPKLILASLQKEKSLISKKKEPSERVMDRALGFGMTDSGDIKKYYGFEKQLLAALEWFEKKWEKYEDKYPPPKITVDDGLLSIQPVNAMTYLMYLYTPWTGGPDSVFYPKWKSHGVYLLWRVWKMYWKEDLSRYEHAPLYELIDKVEKSSWKWW